MHTVVLTHGFERSAAESGMTDEEIVGIVNMLAADPQIGNVVQGTGGFRKFRVAGRGKGKSGGYRIITFFCGEKLPVFLIDVFSKGDKANLTPAQRNALKKIGKEIVDGYRGRVSRLRRAQ